MRGSTALVATVVSGWLYALAFPTTSYRFLAWGALVPWLVALRAGSGVARAMALAWVWAVVAAYGLNEWFPRAVSVYYLQPAWVGGLFFLGVTTFTAAPAFVLFALAWRRLGRRARSDEPLLAAAAWVGAEWLRAHVLGDPWALLGYSQARLPALLQTADYTGIYGTSFVLAAANAALASRWLRRAADAPTRQAARSGVLAVAGMVAVVVLVGTLRLRAMRAEPSRPTVPIAVVQGNLDLGSQWRAEFYGQNLDAYLRLTARALGRTPPPRLVVWPESALTFFLDDEPLYRTAIARVLVHTGALLVTGGPRTANGREPPYHNTAFLLGPDAIIVAWYDKERLLPFAEYFPLPAFDVLRRSFGRVREFTAGVPTPPLPTPAGAAGVIVCNEALFPGPAAARVRNGADLLLALTNDTWVGDRKYARQAFEMTLVRAVEQRRWLVRASTAGPSAVVDPSGTVVAETEPLTAATLAATVAPRTGLTPYARVGDAFAVLCGLVALAACGRFR